MKTVTLLILVVASGCAARAQPNPKLPPADELMDRGDQLEEQGQFRAAAALYLACFVSSKCNEISRLLVGSDLRRMVESMPDLEPAVLRAVREAEGRMLKASTFTQEFRGDLASVVSFYDHWPHPERILKLVARMRVTLPTPVYHQALGFMIPAMPEAFTELSDSDVEHLLKEIKGTVSRNAEWAKTGRLAPAVQADIEEIRVDTAVVYASVLFRSRHRDAGHEAIRSAIDAVPSGCAEMVKAATTLADAAVSADVCTQCAGTPGCEADQAPPKAPRDGSN